jgi:hypothetical protein
VQLVHEATSLAIQREAMAFVGNYANDAAMRSRQTLFWLTVDFPYRSGPAGGLKVGVALDKLQAYIYWSKPGL